ncbi:hypothetical protein SKAU_G00206380 [Synaphobranchus kaupii]|uniref:Uncharacterized protein n=1 Tax=Synaphobranchus kaupii TaxID=118154 RepID=A0A9Q1FGH7_SYNKA|nr:hypothetical protein SKAU_G00206380 [Synaphobranchus kaupii]
MRHSALCHSWLSLRLFDEGTINKWRDCCTVVDHVNGATNYFFSPTLVADWFHESIGMVLGRGPEEAPAGYAQGGEGGEERAPSSRSSWGWQQPDALRHRPRGVLQGLAGRGPELADGEPLLGRQDHGGGGDQRLLPAAPPAPAAAARRTSGVCRSRRSEVQLKKCISGSLMQAYQACKALIIKLLSRPKAVSPYQPSQRDALGL